MSPRQRVELAIIGIRTFASAKLVMVAGLIGGAALGAGVAVAAWPQPAATASDVASVTSCDQQTWPYINTSCLKAGTAPVRQVRMVSTETSHSPKPAMADEKAATDIKAASIAPQPRAASLAANEGPVKTAATQRSAAQGAATTRSLNGRAPVTVHYARKYARGEARRSHQSQYRLAGPIDIAPGRDTATTERRSTDTSRRAMAYDDEPSAGSHTFFVPQERAFGQGLFFQR
jgi:hypothetical protein